MKSIAKKVVSLLVANEAVWNVTRRTLVRAARFAEKQRERQLKSLVDVQGAVVATFPDLTVRNGPFKGLKYPPGPRSVGSMLFPKLLGSYERELQPTIELLSSGGYSDVVNVGCAEGYYAVGLALRIPGAKVHAFDPDRDAMRLCGEMAGLNGVGQRVLVAGFCRPDDLVALPLGRRALILSDCEGYERELFSDEVVGAVARHDLLIEVHDFVDLTISSTLRRRFEPTHDIEIIHSVDDIKKAQTYEYEELVGYSLDDRRELLAELRPAAMEWFFMRARGRTA